MKTISYCLISASLITILFVLHALLYKYFETLPLISLIKASVISLLVIGLNWLVEFFHYIFTLNNQHITNNFDKFIKPIFQLVSWFIIIKVYFGDYSLLNIFVFWVNSLQLLLYLIEIDPRHYYSKFQNFLHYYQIFILPIDRFDEDDQQECHDDILVETQLEYSPLLKSSSTINIKSNFDLSRPSFSSDQTLFNKISYADLPKRTEPKDIPHTIKSKVDTLYSVSPRNTYHLNTAVALASDFLEANEDKFSNSLTCKLSDNLTIRYMPSYGTFDVMSTIETPKKQQQTPSKLHQTFNWFSWLFPVPPTKTTCPTLKSKLSHYSLINQSTSIHDFESGIQKNSLQHPYIQYLEFVTQFCDFNSQKLFIDPIFQKFGILLIEFPPIYIFFNCINNLASNLLIIMTFYKFSILALIGLIILQLFKQNYIYNQSNSAYYKYITCLEFCFNFSIIFLMILLAVYT